MKLRLEVFRILYSITSRLWWRQNFNVVLICLHLNVTLSLQCHLFLSQSQGPYLLNLEGESGAKTRWVQSSKPAPAEASVLPTRRTELLNGLSIMLLSICSFAMARFYHTTPPFLSCPPSLSPGLHLHFSSCC